MALRRYGHQSGLEGLGHCPLEETCQVDLGQVVYLERLVQLVLVGEPEFQTEDPRVQHQHVKGLKAGEEVGGKLADLKWGGEFCLKHSEREKKDVVVYGKYVLCLV